MDLNHHRAGRGQPLVLLHGVGHHWQTWSPVIPRLKERFEVIAADSPGFGSSPPLPAGVDPTIDAYADAFVGWFDELGLQDPYVAGNSMGGAIALELARRGRARGVTAISPAGFWNDRELRYCQRSLGLIARMPGVVHAPMMALVGSPVTRTLLISNLFARPWRVPAVELRGALAAAWSAPAFTPALEAFARYRFSAARAADLDQRRVTIAWGTRDRLLPYSRQAPRARALLPGARHVALPRLGHVPFYDDPGMMVELLSRDALGG
jgi:pimeloyl-ACP methyl ester carboxylesterase